MDNQKLIAFLKEVLENMPQDWLRLTTHRLDIYDESLAKTEFLDHFNALYERYPSGPFRLDQLPTAYDYIRLGHPLSCVLEWAIARTKEVPADEVISFASQTIPVMAVLRENRLLDKPTRITYSGQLPAELDVEVLRNVYGFNFELERVESPSGDPEYPGSTIFISQPENLADFDLGASVDFFVNVAPGLGSVVLIKDDAHMSEGRNNHEYASKIQHVRRRETIAMTPTDCLTALQAFTGTTPEENNLSNVNDDKAKVLDAIRTITGTTTDGVVASSGLSMQYAISMGLIHEAQEQHPGKAIKFIVPTNCYGGTNDQARRVAASTDNVEVVDWHVDGGNDMVQSLTTILARLAKEDAVPFIIAEIPTNPRVEVPSLSGLKATLAQKRHTLDGKEAVEPVFILDQTFCPNTPFLGENDILSSVKALAYVSGSKFPSGGKCTAGYCVANQPAAPLMDKIAQHLTLCDNEATDLQYAILAEQMPSMVERIAGAYRNTRDFVTFIQETLPEAKINFVSEELAEQGFTPSVFSLDLPSRGDTEEQREAHKRELNLQLINMMIGRIPDESKYCVSYGQLKGCYWTIPATSTQGTTKEGDKDYIARVAVSPDMDLELHKQVFADFAAQA